MFRKLLLFSLLLPAVAHAELTVSDAWIRNLPPSVPVRAGYLNLQNTTAEPLTIVDLNSEAFARVEIHETIELDGSVRMERVPQLIIEANATVKLEPGGLHLMLMQPVDQVKPGLSIAVTLMFAGGLEQTLELIVR